MITVLLGFYLVWCKECVMNQCYQPHCRHFFNSKYCVRPKTVALKKSKMAGEALSVLVFLFLLQPIRQ